LHLVREAFGTWFHYPRLRSVFSQRFHLYWHTHINPLMEKRPRNICRCIDKAPYVDRSMVKKVGKLEENARGLETADIVAIRSAKMKFDRPMIS
jgi:hypothetical protein